MRPIPVLVTTSSFSAPEFPDNWEVIFNPHGRRLTETEVANLIEKHQPVGMIAGVEPLTRAVLERAVRLKAISRCGIGTDSVDEEAVRDLGMSLTITPNAPTASVAELTLGLILSLSRRINQLDDAVRNGNWKGPSGHLLHGKTVGIIGCGRIGTYLARLLQAFGCRLVGSSRSTAVHPICTLMPLNKLLEDSDIVSLHLPHTKETHHLIGRAQLAQMKPTAYLINTARGGLIDEDALVDALSTKQIGGAALDCFAEEPYTGSLTRFDNVILTPHVGSSAKESRMEMEEEALGNLVAELAKIG